MINQHQLYYNTIFSLKTQRIFSIKMHSLKSCKIQSNIIVRFVEKGRFTFYDFVREEGVMATVFMQILVV